MWSKGALVVIKHGDDDIAESLTDAVSQRMVPLEKYNELKRAYEELERKYYFVKKRDMRYWNRRIKKADYRYHDRFDISSPRKKLNDTCTLLWYKVTDFVGKYTKIENLE